MKNKVDKLPLGLRGKILRSGAATGKVDCFCSPTSNLDFRVRGNEEWTAAATIVRFYQYGLGQRVLSKPRSVYDLLPGIVIPANAGIQRGADVDGKPFVHPKRPKPAGKVVVYQSESLYKRT